MKDNKIRTNKKSFRIGYRREVIKLIMANGFLPMASLELWERKKRNLLERILVMEKEGIIEKKKTENGKIIVIKNYNANKEEITNTMSQKLIDQYETTSILQRKFAVGKSRGLTATRAMRTAETFVMMYNADVRTYVDEKPDLEDGINIEDACYYTSIEIKHWEPIANYSKTSKQIKNARTIGVLFAHGMTYSIYNVGSSMIEWYVSGEDKMRTHIEKLVRSKYNIDADIITHVDSAIFFTTKISNFIPVITGEVARRRNGQERTTLMNLDYTYKNIYILPYDNQGKNMLRILCCPEWQFIMKSLFFINGEKINTDDIEIACDAYDEQSEQFVLLFCIPNISKLRLFVKRALIEKKKNRFRIICFKNQLPLILPLVCYKDTTIAEVSTVDFESFYQTWINNIYQ